MSIQNSDPDPKDSQYLKLAYGRSNGVPDEEVARQLGFSSTAALYRHLSNPPAYPVCPECGASPVAPGHCEPGRKRRPATGAGDMVNLPPAARATDIFTRALEKAAVDLTHLERRRERLEGERFVVRKEWVLGFETPRERTSLARGYVDEEGNERWELEEAAVAPGEASPVPPEPLTSLVAMAILTGTPVEELVEKLHPMPEEVDETRLAQAVEELSSQAGELATLVRGGRLRRGPRTEVLKPVENAVALYARRRRQEGVSYPDILAELRDGAMWRLPEGLTEGRLKRLAESGGGKWR